MHRPALLEGSALPAWYNQAAMKPHKNRGVAIMLALLLGGIGAHRFYVGRIGTGFLYLLFFWTFIPAILALAQAAMWSLMREDDFHARYA